MNKKLSTTYKAPSVDRRLRFVRTSTRRLKELSDLVTLLQALATRSRTYIHTAADRDFLFAVWRDAINNVRVIYGYPTVPLTTHESLLVKQYQDSATNFFEFPNKPISDKNRKFQKLGASRFNKILLQLTRLEAFATSNYVTNKSEITAMINLVDQLYTSTLLEFEPAKPIQDYTHILKPVTYSMLSLNVHGIAGTRQYAPANLVTDVWPALNQRGSLPDILLLNELSKKSPGYPDFLDALVSAGYQTFSDPRSANDHYNECLVAVGPRLLLPTSKVEMFSPTTPSGLDYLAVKFEYLETPTVLIAYRLHEFLTKGQDKNMVEHYKSIAKIALPELKSLLTSFNPSKTMVLAAGDNNHGKIRRSYEGGYSQQPASLQRQAEALKPLGINYLTPETGFSYYPARTSIDHILTAKSVTANNISYEFLPTQALDHAALTADIQFKL